jgi:hypothetical protein
MATTTTTTNAVSQKVASWIDLEHRCVTTQRICQQQNLSRKEASVVLEELYDATKHQAIVCHMEKTEQDGVPTTGTCGHEREYRCGYCPLWEHILTKSSFTLHSVSITKGQRGSK